MSRFYVPKESVKGAGIVVSGKEAHHIVDVMRMNLLDKVVVFDGTGKEYAGFIKEIKRKNVIIEIVETRSPASRDRAKVTLIQALPKKDKMDYIIEKATELGVYSIIPVVTQRTIPIWDERKSRAVEDRWREIAKSAAKQSGRTDMPRIARIEKFSETIIHAADFDMALIAALSDKAEHIGSLTKDFRGGAIAIAIGPEGDFTPGEVSSAIGANFKLANLGSQVLKSDTAAVAALAILGYELTKQ